MDRRDFCSSYLLLKCAYCALDDLRPYSSTTQQQTNPSLVLKNWTVGSVVVVLLPIHYYLPLQFLPFLLLLFTTTRQL
ncbi:hypothetical protein IV203_024890 [Nitzschia inconspicua]|uniref:Uncharacterized protein n=1 Tax=Nitzschia inconspicua TaxID=303405 RepID=A0A9K3K3T6_9STRA|nr:hypothetical protein IV203_025018 [Nitzschia inconspicua]KAG7336659.1 hypothetical protein IV203_024890 [Nitzschia inconspicua]